MREPRIEGEPSDEGDTTFDPAPEKFITFIKFIKFNFSRPRTPSDAAWLQAIEPKPAQ